MAELEFRNLSYPAAILEAHRQLMSSDPNVMVMGLGVDDPVGILGTTKGLVEEFGSERVFDTPLSEDAMTGVAIGLAVAGLRPIHVHIRVDFLMLAMNQLVNVAAKTHYMFGGEQHVPMVVRAIIGKSWGQGAQHSQALQSMFMHVPGLRVAMPSTPYDAKGCLIRAVRDDNPVIILEHRLLYYQEGPVEEKMYEASMGRARVTKSGSDITIVGISAMQIEAFRAAGYLAQVNISAEVIDPVWLSPLDVQTILNSVRKTKRLLVVDNAWLNCGAAAEIITGVLEDWGSTAMPKVSRMGFAECPCPTAPSLEKHFYPNAKNIAERAWEIITGSAGGAPDFMLDVEQTAFRGPF